MEKEKILIIDDDPNLRRTLSDILKAKGYEPFVAGNGKEGLEVFRQHQAKVVVIDLGLPDMGGLEVLKGVKAQDPSAEAIILTGNASLDSAIEATNRGAFSYLLKPYDIEQLLLHIKRALEKLQVQENIARHKLDLERTNAELKAFNAVSSAVSRTIDMNSFLSELLQTLMQLEILKLDSKGAAFLVEEDRLRLVSRMGVSEADLESCRSLRFGDCLCGLAVQTGEIIVSSDSHRKEGTRYSIKNPALVPRQGQVIVPLKAAGKVVGVLCLYTQPGVALDENVPDLLRSMAGQIAIALENVRLYEETKSLSLRDPLTGLANRRLLQIQLEKALEAARRYGDHLSAIMLDIDHFKDFNDRHGHIEGDRLLVRIAGILSREIRGTDYVFRYGGEEFLAVLPRADLNIACCAAERLRRSVESETGVTVSLGVAKYHHAMNDEESLIRRADKALYRAKQNGRNRVEIEA